MATGPVLTYSQIQSLWVQNGGSPGWAPLAAAIAIAESGGNTVALNNNPKTGDYSVGLWQINYFGDLLNSRTAQFGDPAVLQNSPDAQAKAAVKLSGNGSNWQAWKNDAAWRIWQNHGSPSEPTAQQLISWGAPTSSAGGQGGAGNAEDVGSNPTPDGTGCAAKGKIFGVWELSFSYCQGKALVGGLLVGMGGAIAIVGVFLIMQNTKAGKTALRAAGSVGGKGAGGRGGGRVRAGQAAPEVETESEPADVAPDELGEAA